MNVSIRYKLLPVIIIGVVTIAAILYFVSYQARQSALDKQIITGIQSAQKTFHILEQNDTKLLKTAIIDFMTNQGFKDMFLANNRKKLYDYSQDLFAQHKALGITHLYFHRKDGTVFVRAHNADKYDDQVTRKTFAKSKRSRSWGTGIELGKTAFALRVVHPYMNGNNLIGYVEFGEEIDHFIEIMKEQTGHEYAVVVNKKYIDPDKWASVRGVKGLRDNYNDLKDSVVIDTTMEDAALFKDHLLTPEMLANTTDEGSMFGVFELGERVYAGGGFALYDAGGDRVGSVVTINDITAIETSFEQASWNMLLTTVIGVILIAGIMALLVSRIVITPLERMVEATTRVAGGDFLATVDVKSHDEIGRMAELINQFKQMMINTASELKKLRAKRPAEVAQSKVRKFR
jgi:HAMP domain-containing protein